MSGPQSTATTSAITDAERILRLLAGTSEEPGYLEIVAGRTRLNADGKPTSNVEILLWSRNMSDEQRASIPHTRRFLLVDPATPSTIQKAVSFAKALRNQYGNVYFGRALYRTGRDGKPHRDEALAIPNQLVFVDDVAPEHAGDFAVYIQTSETSGHAYKLLDHSLNAIQYADVARRLAAYYGGDPSGVDYVQLGRWPNTINTKGHLGREGYPVRLLRFEPEQVETLEAIRTAYPQPKIFGEGTRARGPSGAAAGDWRNLPDGAALIKSTRWGWMCDKRPQLRMLLVTHDLVITRRKTGQADTTLSAQRASFVSNLLQLYNPPPLAEIRAVALVLKSHIGPDLTEEQYRTAIDREITHYLHVHYTTKGKKYQPTPTSGIRAAPSEPRPRGRHYNAERTRAAQVDRLRVILQSLPENDYGVITLETSAIAAKLNKSARMVRYYLRDLVEQKEISFATAGRGYPLSIILLNRFGKPNQFEREKEIKSPPDLPTEVAVLPIPVPSTANSLAVPLESTGDRGVYVHTSSRVAISDLQAPVLAPQTLSEAVELVLHQVDKREFGRKRLTIVRQTLAVVYGYTDTEAINGEIKRQESIFVRERRECWRLSPEQLVARIRARTKAATRNAGKRAEGKYRTLLEIAEQVRQQRGIEMPPVSVREKSIPSPKSQRAIQPPFIPVQLDMMLNSSQQHQIEPIVTPATAEALLARLFAMRAERQAQPALLGST